jgi:tetratricopeptide (TPR) repeat protein
MNNPARLGVGLVIAATLALSCAGPNKLAQQSEKAYSQGELEKAYQKAARALRKDPENRRARAAMTQAASQLMTERETEIRGIAARDTVAAAKRALALDQFQEELTNFRIVLPPDPEFARDEAAIRHGAAGTMYGQAVEDLGSGAPKRAYDEFQIAQQFEPRYRDVARRIQQAYDEAEPRVAFFPFANETDLGVLSKGFADRAYTELSRRIASSDFRFTELVPRERVYEAVPIAVLDRVSARQAARIGRDLGVDRVIVGRFYGMRSNTNTGQFTQTVYHKTVDKDETGASRERYVERAIDVLTRDREISVGYEYSVVDVQDGSVITGNSGTLRAAAHAVYTSSPVGGEDEDYCLVPPDVQKQDPERAKHIESEWQDRCGDWKLTDLIARSRREHARGYDSRYQDDWVLRADGRAVFLGDVPPEGDLVKLAFGQVWEPLAHTLHDLDQMEPRENPGIRH